VTGPSDRAVEAAENAYREYRRLGPLYTADAVNARCRPRPGARRGRIRERGGGEGMARSMGPSWGGGLRSRRPLRARAPRGTVVTPLRRCLGTTENPRCPNLTAGSRCPKCHADRERERLAVPGPHGRRGSTVEWRYLRLLVLRRDLFRCVVCGSPFGLEVHHIDGNPEHNGLTNLETLCGPHHKERHRSGPQSS
jgi:5-methylcytosine-specific restriction endonuclease McrA